MGTTDGTRGRGGFGIAFSIRAIRDLSLVCITVSHARPYSHRHLSRVLHSYNHRPGYGHQVMLVMYRIHPTVE